MIPKTALMRIVVFFIPILFACESIAIKALGVEYWWAGVLVAQWLYFFLCEGPLRGFAAISRLGHDRIKLNVEASGHKLPVIFPFQIHTFVLCCTLAGLFLVSIKSEVKKGLDEISQILAPEELFLRVEYPTWSNVPAQEMQFSEKTINVSLDNYSYFEVKINNSKLFLWDVSIDMKSLGKSDTTINAPALSKKIGRNVSHRVGFSVAKLYELFNIDKSSKAQIIIKAKDANMHEFKASILVLPLIKPFVSLELSSAENAMIFDNSRVFFKLKASSKIPFIVIDLLARTKSGYRFSKIAAEYAGNQVLNIENLSTELNILGVPFSPEDTLFVKAVAKTIVPGLEGESGEVEIKIRTNAQIREQLIKKLTETFAKLEEGSANWHEFAMQSLQESITLSETLGFKSLVRRRSFEAQMLIRESTIHKDPKVIKAKKKIKEALESLKRSQNLEQSASLLARIQGFISALHNGKIPKPSLIQDANSLVDAAIEAKKGLQDIIATNGTGLSVEEKKVAQDLLLSDKTESYLKESIPFIEKDKFSTGEEYAQKSLQEARTKMAAAMQMLMGARQRAIRAAKEHLANADQKLQQARSKSYEQAKQETHDAQKELDSIASLSNPFDESLENAKMGTKKAEEYATQNNRARMTESLDKAQDAIVKAIAALQDMEEQDRKDMRSNDGFEEHASRELLTTQGVLDAGWRKRILDEIARLKSQGEQSDSPTLKFLESRLR